MLSWLWLQLNGLPDKDEKLFPATTVPVEEPDEYGVRGSARASYLPYPPRANYLRMKTRLIPARC